MMTGVQVLEIVQRVRAAVAKRVVGQEPVIDEALVAFLARGHALLEGVPGTAKTLLVRALAGALGARFGRIQFTPDLMPSDITGINVLRDGGRTEEFHAGPVFTVAFSLAKARVSCCRTALRPWTSRRCSSATRRRCWKSASAWVRPRCRSRR